jgi:hypothetical protein
MAERRFKFRKKLKKLVVLMNILKFQVLQVIWNIKVPIL